MQKISKMLSKVDLSDNFKYPAYSSDSMNNGIIGYTNKPEFICSDTNPVYITFGDHTITFNIAKKSFSVLDNVKVLLPLLKNKDEKILLFIISIWKKLIPNLGYSRHWKVAKKCMLKLPIKDENLGDDLENIDFKFMEDFIAELEAYLITTNLKDYNLTTDEKQALKDFENLETKKFKLDELFCIEKTKSFNKNRLTDGDEYDYITRTSLNQGILQQTGFVNKENLNEPKIWSLGLLQMDFFIGKNIGMLVNLLEKLFQNLIQI